MHYNGFFIFLFILIGRSYAFLRLENLTVIHNDHVQFRCTFPRNFSPNNSIIQWKKIRVNDDALMISINGKIPNIYEKMYRTDLTNQFNRPYTEIVAQPSMLLNEKIIGIESHEQKLACLIDANPAVTSVYWTINNTNIVSREINVYLSRLTSEQSGIYTCVVENAIGKTNQSVYLDVQYGPRVYAMESRVVVNRSNTANLRCYVDSNPAPYQIVWFKNGYEIFRQNQLSDLRIDDVERNDTGLYTCAIYNRLRNNSTRNSSTTIELIVQSRPILETTYSKIAAEIGQTLTLTCRVSGQPKPSIYWKRNEQIMNCDEIVDDKCYLKLFHIAKKDFGSYRCIAENLLGKEEWTYTIVSRDMQDYVERRLQSVF
ncbi:unnamed protein product [Rotaria magnacalcarata]|uniref:Ig-like domain-containing protein n=1 Tax=Rotaria magnacalcarata TaxID=392030 RepID=A0A8S2VUR2_9BILA|nr:unnamed protein product [Rotaria magnacalcarata]